MIDLDLLLERAGQHARRILIDEQAADLTPFFHLIARPPQQDALVLCRWQSDAEKVAAIRKTRELADAIDAEALLFVGEAWVVTRHTPTPWHRKRALTEAPPSEQPDRKECVVATATDGETSRARIWEIVRTRPGGSIVALVEAREMRDGFHQSRLTDGILPRRERRKSDG